MTIEQTEGALPEMPGKVYDSIADLKADIDDAQAQTLRFWGQKYEARPSPTIKGAIAYYIIDTPDDPGAYFDVHIFQIKYPDDPTAMAIILDVFDPSRKDKNGHSTLMDHIRINPKNISDRRIEPIPTGMAKLNRPQK